LEFRDILPEDAKQYDKMRPPKIDGTATKVHFHVTVMGLDSIDENAMVTIIVFKLKIILQLNVFFFYIYLRHTLLIFFLLKHGRIIGFVYRKT